MTAKTPEERIADLGLALPPAAAAVANYVPWVITGNLVMTSGNLPWAERQARLCRKNRPRDFRERRLQVVSALLPECSRTDQGGGRRTREGETHRAAGRGVGRRRSLQRSPQMPRWRVRSHQHRFRRERPPHAHDLHQPGYAARLHVAGDPVRGDLRTEAARAAREQLSVSKVSRAAAMFALS